MDYEGMQDVIRCAQVQRSAALGNAIGEACAWAWLALVDLVRGHA